MQRRRVLPKFLRTDLSAHVLLKNRVVVLEYLRSLSEQSNVSLQETCILAWGHIAR